MKNVFAQKETLKKANSNVVAWDLGHLTLNDRNALAQKIANETGLLVKFVGTTMMVDAEALNAI